MTKILFLLSAAVMALSCFFSWQNRQSFVDARKSRQAVDVEIKKELASATAAANETGSVKAEVTALAGELEAEKTRLEQGQIKLRNAKSEGDRATADLAAAKKDLDDIKAKIENLPPGVTPENLGESINKLKTTIAENENKAKEIGETVAAKEREVKKATDDVTEIQRRVEDRKKYYNRNSFSATVIAVNNDWGFVVVDAGKNREITPDTRLLVARGRDTIAKLSIISVQNTRTVASIDRKSVRPGMSVAPGDRVILETLYQ
ncbi:MAG TPA: hypothetical protein VGH65_07510 [Verrucomicrobiaceae bacterium]|jgi:hypothetical protein